jgi:hypothetical protein
MKGMRMYVCMAVFPSKITAKYALNMRVYEWHACVRMHGSSSSKNTVQYALNMRVYEWHVCVRMALASPAPTPPRHLKPVPATLHHSKADDLSVASSEK